MPPQDFVNSTVAVNASTPSPCIDAAACQRQQHLDERAAFGVTGRHEASLRPQWNPITWSPWQLAAPDRGRRCRMTLGVEFLFAGTKKLTLWQKASGNPVRTESDLKKLDYRDSNSSVTFVVTRQVLLVAESHGRDSDVQNLLGCFVP